MDAGMDIEAAITKAADCMQFSPLKEKQIEVNHLSSTFKIF